MKEKLKVFLAAILFTIGILAPMFYWKKVVTDSNKEHNAYIGRMVSINGDTLMVVKWGSEAYATEDCYTLSNGVRVSDVIVFNNVIE